jgi:hypothetical protein
MSGKGRDGMTEFLDASSRAVTQGEGLRGQQRLDVPAPVQLAVIRT